MYNLRARYYDPSNGRFLTRDTIGYDIASPLELNRYGYTANNPVNAIDPTSHQAFSEYVTNSLKGAGLGAVTNFGFDVAYQTIFLERGLNEIDWTQAFRSAIAGAAAGFVGGVVGTGGISYFGKNFAGVVLTGMLDGWLSGLTARGVANLLSDKSFFDGYSPQAALSDAIVGGLMAGFFYSIQRSIYSVISAPTNRSGLRNAMGDPPSDMIKPQAHHNFPWKFRNWFSKRGINVNDPESGRWVEGSPGPHQEWSGEYNDEWQKFIDKNPNASKMSILNFLRKLLSGGRFPSE